MKRVLFIISITIIYLFVAGGALADPPANDSCANAYDFGTLVSGYAVQNSGTFTDATQDCEDSYDNEVWVKFTITSCMDVTIDFCDEVYRESACRYLYSVCPCDDETIRDNSDYCGSNFNPIFTWLNLEAGTYYYPIWSDMGEDQYIVNVTAVDCPTTPDNDDCANATAIGEVTDLAYSTRAASFDGEGTCMSSPNVWYVYTPTFTGDARISLDVDYASQVAVYDDYSCSPLPTSLGCTESSQLDFAVVTGQQYLIEIGGSEGDIGDGSFAIAEAPEPPANDDCADATDAGTLEANATIQLSGTLVNATRDCSHSYDSEVWVKFTVASCMDVTIDFCDDENSYEDISGDLYSVCPCDDETYRDNYNYCESNYNPIHTWLNLEAGTYYYPIWSDYGYDSYVVNITGVDCPAAPANDDCANAIEIGEVEDNEFTTRSATYDGSGSCITSGGNVWFVYTPTFTDIARINLSGSDFSTIVAVYDGDDCSTLPLRIFCTEESQYDFEVVSGQQYLIEIGGKDEDFGNGVLSIGEIPEAPFNDVCENADDGGTLSSGSTVQFTGTTAGATQDCMWNDFPEVWIKFTVPSCMDITIDFCDNEDDVRSSGDYLYPDCLCEDNTYANTNDYCENDNPSYTWYSVEAGTYYYAIFPYRDAGGDYVVNVTGVDCPEDPEPDFSVTAPYSGTNTTAGDDCYLYYQGADHIYEVTIPTSGNWIFSLCNSSVNWLSIINLGTSVCENDIETDQDACDGSMHGKVTAYNLEAGVYYLTIDGSNGEGDEYTLDITSLPLACDGSYYTNSDTDLNDGIDSYRDDEYDDDYFAADDFTITEDVTLDSIKFICFFENVSDDYFNDRGDYIIMADNEGVPGTVLYEGIDVDCSRTKTEYYYNEEDRVYAYQFDSLGIALPAGTYFIACRTVSTSTKWLTTDSQSGSTAYYNKDDSGWEISDIEADLAFCLFATTSGGDTYEYLPGDANMAAEAWPAQTIGGDVTYLVNYFRGLADPCYLDGFYASADATGDCMVVGGDVTYLVNYFRGLADMSYCSDYEPAWPTPSDVPTDAPEGWPNCD